MFYIDKNKGDYFASDFCMKQLDEKRKNAAVSTILFSLKLKELEISLLCRCLKLFSAPLSIVLTVACVIL